MNNRNMKFAFLVHPRDLSDVFKKYPLLNILPNRLVEYFLIKFWPPVFVAKITGLKSKKEGIAIDGCVISIPMTARQMVENRELASRKILKAAIYAKKLGAEIIGLGALTSSFSKGGLDLIDNVDVHITTGHAYTAYNVTKNVFELCNILELDKRKITVAIVGAAGSIGSTSARILARAGYRNLLLIDLERKHHFFKELASDLLKSNPAINVEFSHQVRDVIKADIIITATNAPEALVKLEDLKMGAIIVDDAQPSDISKEVFDCDDVLVVSAGVVHTSGVETHFNFGLVDKYDNFCCLAELLILAAHKWDNHYVINRATLESVDEISAWGSDIGFKLGKFQGPKGLISSERINKVKMLIHQK
jgi:predicted amino acid dehydrogenase